MVPLPKDPILFDGVYIHLLKQIWKQNRPICKTFWKNKGFKENWEYISNFPKYEFTLSCFIGHSSGKIREAEIWVRLVLCSTRAVTILSWSISKVDLVGFFNMCGSYIVRKKKIPSKFILTKHNYIYHLVLLTRFFNKGQGNTQGTNLDIHSKGIFLI